MHFRVKLSFPEIGVFLVITSEEEALSTDIMT